MNRLLLTAFTSLLISYTATSQLTKGTWLVGGSGQLYLYNQNYLTSAYSTQYKYVNIDISASTGYFVADKLVLGLRPYVNYLKGKNFAGSITGSGRYGIGPFSRYYFLQEEKSFNILVDASYLFGVADLFGPNGKLNIFSVATGPVIFFNSSIGLEFLLGYTAKTEEIPNDYKDVRNGFQVSIGFQFHLNPL